MRLPSFLKPVSLLKNLLLFFVIFTLASIWSTRNHLDGPAPSFSILDLDGNAHFFEFNNVKKPLLIHFFATWCPICKLENDSLNNLAKDHQLIVIAMQSGDAEEVKAYRQEHHLSMTLYNDKTGVISKRFNVTGVPTSFIVNRQGKITSSTIGYTSELGLRFRLWLSQF